MGTIWIDGTPHPADGERNLLAVSLELGYDLPYFCWHPAMGSVGACRQCAVKQFRDERDENGRLVMACMTAATDGTRLSITDPEAAALRSSVIEWLMVNHPHDCPVCDEGGECHLQDMTVMTGHTYRRFRFPKRTYRNQHLGPFVTHEMNRCIQCYRCVRFYRDHAGGDDLQAFGAHDRLYFGRDRDGVLESEFAGNLVEVCPTGVFTDKTLARHYTRKWDFQTAPSVCVHCSLGCNTIPAERYGELRRVQARYHGSVNGHFLCDRGRYGYEFVNSERRIRQPLAPRGAGAAAEPLSGSDAVRRAAEFVSGDRRVIGIGSARATVESNAALRTLVGPDAFYHAVGDREHRVVSAIASALQRGPSRSPGLREIESCDAVLVLGEDVTNTAPMMDLAIRQAAMQAPRREAIAQGIPGWHEAAIREAVQRRRGPVFIATSEPTKLDGLAAEAVRASPEAAAELGFAVAHALDPDAPEPEVADDVRERARRIAAALRAAERPLVVSGAGARCEELVRAAANAAWATAAARDDRRPAELAYALPAVNSLGLALLGGPPLERAAEAARAGQVDTVVILEADLHRHAPREDVDALLSSVGRAIVIDHLAHDTGARADLVLPAATFAEGDGDVVNSEGRAQRQYQVFVPEGDVREAWRWLGAILGAAGRREASHWREFDAAAAVVAHEQRAFARLPEASEPATERIAGARIARAPHRYSGRTAFRLRRGVLETAPPDDPDSPMSFSMEGSPGVPPGRITPYFRVGGWNSVQALTRFVEEINGPLRGGDPGVRLVEPSAGAPAYARAEVTRGPADTLRVVPRHHIFGSEALSALSPGVRELSPPPYIELHPDDAARLGATAGRPAELVAKDLTLRLPVRIDGGRARGTVGVPAGIPEIPVSPPRWAEVRAS